MHSYSLFETGMDNLYLFRVHVHFYVNVKTFGWKRDVELILENQTIKRIAQISFFIIFST